MRTGNLGVDHPGCVDKIELAQKYSSHMWVHNIFQRLPCLQQQAGEGGNIFMLQSLGFERAATMHVAVRLCCFRSLNVLMF